MSSFPLDRRFGRPETPRATVRHAISGSVKHFKWEPRGKKRIHKRSNSGEIAACRPWLDTEIRVAKPQAIVCLGATAAQALLGAGLKGDETRHAETKRFVDDLRVAAKALRS